MENNQGFTLLETIIALTIMVIAFASILSIESGSINSVIVAKQMNVVAMLAKNQMVETELAFEGKTFDEFKKEDAGTFKSPYEDYRWTSVIKEVEFPALNIAGGGDQNKNDVAELMTKIFTKFLSKSSREVTVTVFFKQGSGEKNFTVSTYWVDLNHEFELSP